MALPDYGPRNPPAPVDPTKPAPPPPYVDQNRPGHWVGNQWVYNDVLVPPDPNALPEGGYKDPVAPAPPPPVVPAPAPAERYQAPVAPAPAPAPAPTAAPAVSPTEGQHTVFVRSKNGGFVPANHPDADPNSPEIDMATGQPMAAAPGQGQAGQTSATGQQGLYSASNTPPPTGAPTTIQDAYRQVLMGLLTGPSPEQAAAGVNDSPAVAAFRNEQMRSLDRNRAGIAEQSGLNGLQNSGGFQGQTEALRQAAGENTAGYAGEQANQLMAARRAELMQGLQLAQAAGQFDQAQALQLQLAKMDEALRNRGFDIQQQLGSESNANQRYATEIQKLLGMSDVDLRKYLGEMTNATNRYGIDTSATTSANDLNYRAFKDWWDSTHPAPK